MTRSLAAAVETCCTISLGLAAAAAQPHKYGCEPTQPKIKPPQPLLILATPQRAVRQHGGWLDGWHGMTWNGVAWHGAAKIVRRSREPHLSSLSVRHICDDSPGAIEASSGRLLGSASHLFFVMYCLLCESYSLSCVLGSLFSMARRA